MEYAVEKGSGSKMYIPSFIQIGSGFLKLRKDEIRRHTYNMEMS
jgi:hypothetical protein